MSDYVLSAGSIDITPLTPCALAGWQGRKGVFTAVADPLEANVVVIRSRGETAIFVSVDLLYLGWTLRNMLEQRLAGRIASEWLFVSASHTHFAPATDDTLPKLGEVSPDYIEFAASRIGSLIDQLLGSDGSGTNPCLLRGKVDSAVDRRLAVKGVRLGFPPVGTRWEMRPNFTSSVDSTVRVMVFRDPLGQPQAICWSYACHPVGFPEKTKVSADYPGVVRAALRRRYGDIPVLFWQGFAGDLRPRPVKEQSSGLALPAFLPFTLEEWRGWAGEIAAHVNALVSSDGIAITGSLSAVRREVPLTELGLRAADKSLVAHEIGFGDQLVVFGMSAEPVNAYSNLLVSAMAPRTVIPVGCLDGVFGYLPTSEIISQGGYEADGYFRLFGVSRQSRPDVTDVIEGRLFRRQ